MIVVPRFLLSKKLPLTNFIQDWSTFNQRYRFNTVLLTQVFTELKDCSQLFLARFPIHVRRTCWAFPRYTPLSGVEMGLNKFLLILGLGLPVSFPATDWLRFGTPRGLEHSTVRNKTENTLNFLHACFQCFLCLSEIFRMHAWMQNFPVGSTRAANIPKSG